MSDLNNMVMNFRLPDLKYKKNDKYIIYGTGEVAEGYYYKISEIYGSDIIECFIDSLLDKNEFLGKKVMKPHQLKKDDIINDKFIIGSFSSSLAMSEELQKIGVPREHIICGKNYSEDSFAQSLETVNRVVIYPKIKDKNEIEKFVKKINWFVPLLSDSELKIEIPTETENLSYEVGNNVRLVTKIKELKYKEYDLILVWNKDYLDDEILVECKNVYCIDPMFFFMIDMKILVELNNVICEKNRRKELQELSKRNYQEFYRSKNNTKMGIICGTGPSLMDGIQQFLDLNMKSSIKVACNACINSSEFMKRMQPNLYMLSDIKYLTEEHKDELDKIIDYILKKEDSLLIVPSSWIVMIGKKYRGIENKLVGIELNAKSIHFPTAEDLSVYKKAHSIITRFALPVVSSMCDIIYIVGCDGIDLNAKEYVLPHFETDEDSNEKMNKEIFDAQLFTEYTKKNQDEKDMFQKHYTYMGNMIDYGQSIGKTYVALTDSYIPKVHELFMKNR